MPVSLLCPRGTSVSAISLRPRFLPRLRRLKRIGPFLGVCSRRRCMGAVERPAAIPVVFVVTTTSARARKTSTTACQCSGQSASLPINLVKDACGAERPVLSRESRAIWRRPGQHDVAGFKSRWAMPARCALSGRRQSGWHIGAPDRARARPSSAALPRLAFEVLHDRERRTGLCCSMASAGVESCLFRHVLPHDNNP